MTVIFPIMMLRNSKWRNQREKNLKNVVALNFEYYRMVV